MVDANYTYCSGWSSTTIHDGISQIFQKMGTAFPIFFSEKWEFFLPIFWKTLFDAERSIYVEAGRRTMQMYH